MLRTSGGAAWSTSTGRVPSNKFFFFCVVLGLERGVGVFFAVERVADRLQRSRCLGGFWWRGRPLDPVSCAVLQAAAFVSAALRRLM